MNLEEIQDLLLRLEEVKDSFDLIIGKMKERGINYPYESVQYVVDSNYGRTVQDIYGLVDLKYKHDTTKEYNKSGLKKLTAREWTNETSKLILVATVAYIGHYWNNTLTKEDNLRLIIATAAGCAASVGVSLIGLGVLNNAKKKNPNISQLPSELYGMQKDFKASRKQIVKDIKDIQTINKNLTAVLKQNRPMSFARGL